MTCDLICGYCLPWTPEEIEDYNAPLTNPDGKLSQGEVTCSLDIEGNRLVPGKSPCIFPNDQLFNKNRPQ